jgi:hypothetical protein
MIFQVNTVKLFLIFISLLVSLFHSTLLAGEADVIQVAVEKSSNNTYSFSVTILHKDAGWDHYVNKWEIIGEKGTIMGTRILHHPHVNEQPFTRSLSGIVIPDHIESVRIRAYDSIHEYGGKVITVELP